MIGARLLTLRTGLVLMGSAITIGFFSSLVLVRHHRRYDGTQYVYSETFPLGESAVTAAWVLTIVLGVAGVACLVGAAVRDQPSPGVAFWVLLGGVVFLFIGCGDQGCFA